MYLALVSKVEGQIRDLFTERSEDGQLTQTALAEKLGVHRSVIQRRLTGRSNMTLETVADMVWAVGGCIDVDIYDPAARPDKNHTLAQEAKGAWQEAQIVPVTAPAHRATSWALEGTV